MTISSTNRKAGPYIGNGSASAFPFSFKVFTSADLYVVKTDTTVGVDSVITLGTDYAVALNADQNANPGGTITLTAGALASGFNLTITSSLAYLQPTDLTNQGGFYPSVITNALDRLTIFCQQLYDAVSRSLKVSVSTPSGVSTTLPPPAANRLIGWNPTADALQNMDATTLATIVAFGTANADQFSGDGVTTQFALSANPGALNNLDISIGGVTQRPGVDYTWVSDTTLTFTNAPPVGTNNVLARYMLALPQGSSDATSVVFTQSGAGAVPRSVDIKLKEQKSPSDFAAVGNNITDDTDKLQKWANSPDAKVGENKTFKCNGTVTFTGSHTIDFRGMVIDCSGGGQVLFTGSTVALPALSADVSKDGQTLSFSSAHNLSANDVGLIFNPSASSWSSVRSYYYAGEFFQCARVTGATSLTLSNPLYASYTSTSVSMYKLSKCDVAISNLTVIGATDSAKTALQISLATKVRASNVNVPSSNYNGIYFDRCFDVEVSGSSAKTQTTSTVDAYGLLIGSCQNVRIFGGYYYSKRGAIELGGDDFIGSVPNRNIVVVGATADNDFSSNFPAVDLHANLDGIRFCEVTIRGGASFAGMNVTYDHCDFQDAPGGVGSVIYGGSEWLGGVARVNGGKMRGTGTYSAAPIRIVANTASKADTYLYVENLEVDIAAGNTVFVKTEMSTSTYKLSTKIDQITFTSAPGLTQVLRCQGTGSAGDGNFAIVDRISSAPAGTYLYITANGYGAATPVRLMQQNGYAQVALSTGVPFTSVTPAYKYSYGSKVPNLGGVVLDTRLIGTKVTTVHYRLLNASTVTFDVGLSDNTNPSSPSTVVVQYSVGLNEV